MLMEWKVNSVSLIGNKLYLLYCISIFFFSICSLFSTTTSSLTFPDRRRVLSAKVDINFQELEKAHGKNMPLNRLKSEVSSLMMGKRRCLIGPGSSPPRCMSKCGKCMPCKPVHVPVPPGTPVTAEYYPEAWRCKCGNKLYIP